MPRDILDWTLDLLKRLPEALLVHFIVRWVERMLMWRNDLARARLARVGDLFPIQESGGWYGRYRDGPTIFHA